MTQVWQACPVCSGTGLVSKPPGIAGDQATWVSTSTGPYPCRVCDGKGVLAAPEGEKKDKDPFDGLVDDIWEFGSKLVNRFLK